MTWSDARRQRAGWMGMWLGLACAGTVVTPSKAAAPHAAMAAQSSAAAAQAAIQEGRTRLEAYEFGPAASSLRRGVDLLLESGTPVDTTLLAEGLVDLAVASMRSGDRAGAQAALADLARLCPEHVVRGARYPPVFLREAEAARLAVEQGPHASLAIGGPRNAEVLIDGRSAGVLPVRLAVPEGRHRVSVGAQAKLVEVGPDGGSATFTEAAGRNVALEPMEADEDARWAQREGSGVPEAALEASGPGEDDGAQVVERAPWWVWPLVGAGMALAIGGTVFGVQQAMDQPVGATMTRW